MLIKRIYLWFIKLIKMIKTLMTNAYKIGKWNIKKSSMVEAYEKGKNQSTKDKKD